MITYNIHPIFVHFPIALLFLYSFIKVIPFKKWFPNVSWRDIERILLVVGVLGALAALYTGDIAEHLVKPDRAIVEMHSLFASTATWLYSILLLGELLSIFNPRISSKIHSQKVKNFFTHSQSFLTHPLFSKICAVAGLVAISVAGLLGGVMVYGTSADPVAGIVLKLLGINL